MPDKSNTDLDNSKGKIIFGLSFPVILVGIVLGILLTSVSKK
jgi:hypothetical protein